MVKPSPEIEAIVRRLLAAREIGDIEVSNRLWSDSEYLVSVGTDEHEWNFGRSELVGITNAQWRESPSSKVDAVRLYAFEHGEVGWAVTEQKRTMPSGRIVAFRQTLIFMLEAGAWKIVHNHFSVPVPNLEVWGVDLTRTLSDLVDSVTDDPSATRRVSATSTLVFTDIVDSTPLSLQLGEDAWHAAITAHLDVVQNIVESEGGSTVKTLGDGGMYAFDSGSAALRAATKIQKAVTGSSEPEMSLRVGVHTGDVVQTEDDYVGATVAKAARVAAAADGGQILVSSTTAGLVNPTDFHFDTPITVELKGLEGTHQLHPLAWS